MTIVRDSVLRVGDTPVLGPMLVQISVEADGQIVRSGDGQIIAPRRIKPDPLTGEWTVDIPALDEPGAMPLGAVYRVDAGRSFYHFALLVSHGPGPLDVENLLTDPPGALPPSGLAAHQGAPDPHPVYATDADVETHRQTAVHVLPQPPAAHALSHASGADLLTPAAIGAETPPGAQAKVDAETLARIAADALLQSRAEKGQPNGYAELNAAGKLLDSALPNLAINDTFVVNSQAAMLALVAQRGDVAIRTDQTKNYILTTDDPSVLANWRELAIPADAVTSVQGLTGIVVLPSDGAVGTASLRTLGTGAQQALPGDHASTTDQRTPLDGSVTGVKVAAAIKDAAAATPSLRTLGTGVQQAASGAHGSHGKLMLPGSFLAPDDVLTTVVGSFATQNDARAHLVPSLRSGTQVNSLSAKVNTAGGAGAVLRMALLSAPLGTTSPVDLVVEGTVDTTTIGIKTLNFPAVTIDASKTYWAAFVNQGSAAVPAFVNVRRQNQATDLANGYLAWESDARGPAGWRANPTSGSFSASVWSVLASNAANPLFYTGVV